MVNDNYSIQHLVADLRRITSETADEHEILSRVRPLARRAALSKSSWLEKRFYAADPDQGFGLHVLHEEPDHSLAIFAVSWLPNRGAPPHNHGTWAIVGGGGGPGKNVVFARSDGGNRPRYAGVKKS